MSKKSTMSSYRTTEKEHYSLPEVLFLYSTEWTFWHVSNMKLMPDELWHFIIIFFFFLYCFFMWTIYTEWHHRSDNFIFMFYFFLYFCVHAHYCVCVTHSQSQNQFSRGIYCQCDFLTGSMMQPCVPISTVWTRVNNMLSCFSLIWDERLLKICPLKKWAYKKKLVTFSHFVRVISLFWFSLIQKLFCHTHKERG